MWKQRCKKFLDNPFLAYTFLRTKFWYTCIADRKSATYNSYTFLSGPDTIAKIISTDTSLIRAGDGTFGYLLGSSIYFNNWHFRYNRAFAKKLRTVMKDGQDANILFCYTHLFIKKTKAEFVQENIENEWGIWVPSKVMLGDFLRRDKVYGDAMCFHPRYNPQIDFAGIKRYLDTKHIIIITSNTERFAGINLGQSTTLIEGPSSDAWRVYESLEQKALTIIAEKGWQPHQVLIMISAAEAAKVMVHDFSTAGYTAWDTGQFFDLAAKEIAALGSQPLVQ